MSMLSRFATLGKGGDPYWDNVSFLLVGNGGNNTTTNIVDSSKYSRLISIFGDTVISTAKSKYGSGSVYVDGSGDYLTTSYASFGTGDFTIEFWVNPSRITGYQCLVDTRSAISTDTGIWIGLNGSTVELYGNGLKLATTGTLTTNAWYFISVVRSNGTVYAFNNGNSTGTFGSSFNYTSTLCTVGSTVGGSIERFNGYFYDLRITTGVARYTATFTPPTAAFPIG